MTSLDYMTLPSEISAEDRNLLAVSGLLDETNYRAWAGLLDDTDAVAHYLEKGWLQGLNPSDGFDGEFLRPYYEIAGRYGPPALTWLELSAMSGRRPPKNRNEAAWLAHKVRTSTYFDVNLYAKRLNGNLDPALHYAVIGEILGWSPSQKFDPLFYLESNPDVADHVMSPLCHYIDYGYREGRLGVPTSRGLAFPPITDRRRPTILIINHEASRTGAPILGWNIARSLAKSYNVVSILMRGGELEDDFTAVSAATIGPMRWEQWDPLEMKYVAERLSATYNPLYAIANSVETHLLASVLARHGVPIIALVHEFAACYVGSLKRMRDIVNWASHIVFPADVVAQDAFAKFPGFANRRGVHVLSQGRAELPERRDAINALGKQSTERGNPNVRPRTSHDAFVVLGLGTVHIRKGVDVFLATADRARRLAPEVPFRFVWIGDGYDPHRDSRYSTYLAEQISRSGLGETVSILDAVDELEPVYANANMYFMCSRLDPQPNVGIDALTRGLPTVCFENASGTAEILYADPETRPLVVPYLDAHAAADVICRFATDPAALATIGAATARVGRSAYNMETYVAQVDDLGKEAAAALHPEDFVALVDAKIVDQELALPDGALAIGAFGAENYVLQQWAVTGTSKDQTFVNRNFRRPCAGFHPQIYATVHNDACGEGGANPLAHWLRCGKPRGRWSRQVFSPLNGTTTDTSSVIRAALHAHFYYVLGAHDLAARLAANKTVCDLFLSTDTEGKGEHLRHIFAGYRGRIDVRVVPNRGRDLGPFLTGLAYEISNGEYDIFGHVHAKRSFSGDAPYNPWRDFLWENLVGGSYAMLDLAINAFERYSDIGLLIAEDPHLVGWGKNRANAESLAKRMGIVSPLDDFFDFPLGTMFWARPGALQPLLGLHLEWEDYPAEPLADDGSILHALERLLPYAATHAGFRIAGLRAPGTTWSPPPEE